MPRKRCPVFRRDDSPFWFCRVRGANGRIVKKSTKCVDKDAAIAVAAQLERESVDPVFKAAHETTVGQAYDDFLAHKKNKADGTKHFYRVKGGHLITVFGENTPLSRIDAVAVDKYIEVRRSQLVTNGRAVGEYTIGKELTVLRGILKLARRHEKYHYSIDQVMPVGWDNKYRPREGWVTEEDLRKLVDAILEPDNADRDGVRDNRAAFVLFTAATGARLSEALKAQRSDVDLAAKRVHLRGTKTERSDRIVPVLPHTEALLRRSLQLAKAAGPLFLPWGNMVRDLAVACAQAGIARVTANDLRRTFGKWLRLRGVAPHLIGDALGHVDERMAKRVYSKLTTEELAALLSGTILTPNNNRNSRKSKQRPTRKPTKHRENEDRG